MTRGTAQRDRFPAALAPGHFRVDDLTFEQRVGMAATLARHLRFVDLDLREAGNWSRLFASDVTLVLARIASVDVRALRRAFLHDAASAPLEHLAWQVAELGQWVDLWFKSLDRREDAASLAFRARIQQLADQQLGEDLRWVYRRFGACLWNGSRIDHEAGRLADIWNLQRPVRAVVAGRGGDRTVLRQRYIAFLSGIAALQQLAHRLLPSTLASGTHEAAAGLLIAFLKVWETVQAHLNQFTARHVDFYYRDCLGLDQADPVADEVHLACARELRAGALLQVPQGTVFEAGKDAAGRPMHFHSAAPLVVTDACVAALCTLRLERDALISPEQAFGFATRAKATQLPLMAEHAAPLFGGGRGHGAEDARLGLAIASPLLLLREGERQIQIELPMAGTPQQLDAHVDAVVAAADAPALHAAFGRLLGHWLVVSEAELTAPQLRALRQAARQVLGAQLPTPAGGGDPLGLLCGTQPVVRELVFDQLLRGLLKLRLSASTGWLEATDVHLKRLAPGGLSIVLRLRAEAPPIVGCDPLLHGPGWGTVLPLLRMELSTLGRLYPYSLLANLPLGNAHLRVSARGLRDVVLSNNLGRLDPTKAFSPFGPLPTLSSYLVVGAAEVACKNIERLRLCFEWGGLSPDAGGFDTHYRGYPDEQRGGDFRVELAILSEGRWQPCIGASAQQPLFAPLNRAGCVPAAMEIEVDPGSIRKHARASEPDDWGAAWPRNGLYRLQLTGPRGAFGHTAYPQVLADVVSNNARTRRLRRLQPLPNPPYTPLIERLTLEYEASGVIGLDSGHQHGVGVGHRTETTEDDERLMHLHPFGIEALHSAASGVEHQLMPRLDHDGNLYIGLSASEPGGTLTLLFQLCESAADATGAGVQGRRVRWATLAGEHWRALPPARVLSDSTEGFLTSGIVTLDLPGDLTLDNSVMPAGLYWLRASADHGFDNFATLLGAQAHALRARRQLAPGAAALAIVPHGSITKPSASLPGLAGVQQMGPSFGLRAAEDARALYTRAGERLQHKQRSSTAWDAERLLLEHFPGIYKVRCLSGDQIAAMDQPRPPAGQVVAVVVPQVPRNDIALATSVPRFNAIELQRMTDYLQERASPFARIVVRNPAYDRLQLRCVLGLEVGVHEGEALQRITRRVVELLSPWFDEGWGVDFDWAVRSEEMEALLRGMPGVQDVSQLSLLHVACGDDAVYTLGDTARTASATGGRHRHATARTPWSLAVPMALHLITTDDQGPDLAPQPTGISRLAIGSTFVVGAPSGGGP